MGVDLSVRSRRKRSWRAVWLSIAILFLGGWLAWQRGWLPQEISGLVEQRMQELGPAMAAQLPQSQIDTLPPLQTDTGSVPIEQVALVRTQVIENPQSEAYTANLHQDTGEVEAIPWPNVGGRTEAERYIVEAGDTLWSIANRFELDIDTIRWSNPELERNPDVLAVGTELVILPVQGVFHYVEEGDTFASIGSLYGVTGADIANYPPNGLFALDKLKTGQGVIVPFGRKDVVLPNPSDSAEFALAWPLVGNVTGGFAADHLAVDIGAPYGSTVYAADDGEVIHAAWAQDGFGYTIIVDHGGGVQTWYSHLKGTLFQAGSYVFRGTPMGEVGSTGHSTGPHVHFEVRVNGERVNPLDYLSPTPQ